MASLRYARWWRAAGWLLAATILAFAVAPAQAVWPASVSDKLLHALSFFALMLWFTGAYERRHYLALFVALLGFGALIEVVQYGLGHRTAELRDWVADGVGVTAGYLFAIAGLGRWCHWVEGLVVRRPVRD